MADKTRAEMIALVLERLGVKSAAASATAEDTTTAGEVVDSLHSRLRGEGLAPFATSAFPDHAQIPFADIAASELLTPYGIGGERAGQIRADAREGRFKLSRAFAGYRQQPIRGRYF